MKRIDKIYEPNFKIIYSLVDDGLGNQLLYSQLRDKTGIISERYLGRIGDIVKLIDENKKLKEQLRRKENNYKE